MSERKKERKNQQLGSEKKKEDNERNEDKQKTVLMLNWIVWNRTVLTFKLRTYAKLNCLK